MKRLGSQLEREMTVEAHCFGLCAGISMQRASRYDLATATIIAPFLRRKLLVEGAEALRRRWMGPRTLNHENGATHHPRVATGRKGIITSRKLEWTCGAIRKNVAKRGG